MHLKKQKECQTKIKKKTPEKRSSNQKCSTCQSRRCPGIKHIFFCGAYNLHKHMSALILNLNITYKITRADCDLLSFSKTKWANDSEENIFQNPSTFMTPRNRNIELDHQIDVLNNLNPEKMETKSESNPPYIE